MIRKTQASALSALLASGMVWAGADFSEPVQNQVERNAVTQIGPAPTQMLAPPLVRRPSTGLRSMTNAGELFVQPEKITALQVSNRDVNRIACPGQVGDVFFSNEKPVTVTPDGESNLYVKFLVQRQGQQQTYVDDPADLHVVCDGAVYTMILHPKPIDSVTIRLGKEPVGVAEVAQEWGALPLEERIKRLTLAIWHNEVPPGFSRTVMPVDSAAGNLYADMMIAPTHTLRGPGSGLRATEYVVQARRAVSLEERYFLRPEFGDVIAITLDPLVLYQPGDRARLIVIERAVRNGQ